MQNVLAERAVDSCHLSEADRQQIKAQLELLRRVAGLAVDMAGDEPIPEDFQLTVFRRIEEPPDLSELYELAVGGPIRQNGLPGKTPINMWLGWQIKNAIGAEVIKDAAGKAQRRNVRDAPIQSFTLLTRP